MSPPSEPGLPASLALSVLLAIAVIAPWAMGAVLPGALLGVTALALVASALALASAARRGSVLLPAVPLWPLAGFLGLALLQLVPLPRPAQAFLAPGSHAVWHPADPVAAAVLGGAWRPVSVDPDTTLRAIALTGGLALLALLAGPALSRRKVAVRAAGAVAAAGFLLSAYAIFARARFGALLYGTIPVPTISPFGPFVSKNHFAGWTAMAAVLGAGLALGLAAPGRGRGRNGASGPGAVLVLVAALAMALAVLASLSRGGAIALASGAAALVVLRVARAGGRGLPLALAFVGALGLGLVSLVPPAAQERLRSLGGSSFRIETWRDSTRLVASSPLVGQGLGAFHDAYPRFKRSQGDVRVEHAENDYLETLAETGASGLGLALAGLLLLLRAAGRGILSSPDRVLRGVGAGALAALLAVAVHSAVDFNLRIPSNAALAALASAVAAGCAGGRPRVLPRAAASAFAATCLGVLVATAVLPAEPWLPARSEALAAASARSPDVRRLRLLRAEAALAGVLDRRPAHAESWLLLAGVRAAQGDAEGGAALARHALRLDPERLGLREAADRLAPPEAP